jgi:hypothetical protein
MAKGGTHYGNMFNEHANANLLMEPVEMQEEEKPVDSNNSSIVIAVNQKNIPLKITNKSRIRISTESMKNAKA